MEMFVFDGDVGSSKADDDPGFFGLDGDAGFSGLDGDEAFFFLFFLIDLGSCTELRLAPVYLAWNLTNRWL
jgi:hypothetical protein